MIYSIYCIKNKVNGKRYIGLTNNIKTRWYNHLYCLRNNIHHNSKLQRAYNKYGESNFEFSIIKTLDCTFSIIAKEEIKYISEYNSCDTGYNLTYGGDGTDARKVSDTTKQKLHKASLGNTYALGKHHSIETKKRQSEAMKSCKDMPERKERARVIMNNLWGTDAFRNKMLNLNIGNTYNLGKHLSEDTKRKISETHKGKNNAFYGKEHTEDTKQLLSKLMQERWKDPFYRIKVKKSMQEVFNSDAYRHKQSILSSGRSNKTTELDAITIRYRYLCGERPQNIITDFPNLSLSGLKKICYASRWKHLPNDKITLYNMLINYQSREKSSEGLETR